MNVWTITGNNIEDFKIQSYRFAAGKKKTDGANIILDRHNKRMKRNGG